MLRERKSDTISSTTYGIDTYTKYLVPYTITCSIWNILYVDIRERRKYSYKRATYPNKCKIDGYGYGYWYGTSRAKWFFSYNCIFLYTRNWKRWKSERFHDPATRSRRQHRFNNVEKVSFFYIIWSSKALPISFVDRRYPPTPSYLPAISSRATYNRKPTRSLRPPTSSRGWVCEKWYFSIFVAPVLHTLRIYIWVNWTPPFTRS